MNDYEQRFGGVGRLYTAQGLGRLRAACVMVVGIGGVGSWAAEALARSGIGTIMLVDMDDICITNTNRQVPALDGGFGRSKAEAMAERISAINPGCRVEPVFRFFTSETAEAILETRPDFVVDAIDSVAHKCELIARCLRAGIPLVSTGGAGGRRNATAVEVADLAKVTHDPLLRNVRKRLRKEHGFSENGGKKHGVPCVFSREEMVAPWKNQDGCEVSEPRTSLKLNCEDGYGSATFVTGTFGFAAAGLVVNTIARD